MYIISKFRDYYDTAAVYGIDKTVVYRRERKEVELPRHRYGVSTGEDHVSFPEDQVNDKGQLVKISEVLVGFCGKIYPAIRLEEGDRKFYAFSAESFFVKAMDFGLEVNWKAKSARWSGIKYWRGGINAGHVRDFFAKDRSKLEKYFVEHHTPIFTITHFGRKQMMIINDCLKDRNFQPIADPVTAFQNVYSYISGVLGAPKEKPSEPSDKIKAQNHGHDSPYSFKKPPGGKRWR